MAGEAHEQEQRGAAGPPTLADYLPEPGGRHRRLGLLILAVGLVVIAAGALVFGALSRQPAAVSRPTDPVTVDRADSTGRPAARDFGALAGYGCPGSPDVSFSVHGVFSDGLDGFSNVRSGGWDRGGCDGQFEAMPMSGSAATGDPSNFALWTFRTGTIVRGTCQVSVYVPHGASIHDVGGDPARYRVYDSAGTSGLVAGSFTVDQLKTRGQWVNTGSYPVTSGVLTVELTSAGQDWVGSVVTHARLAAAQALVFCSPARA
jgi:hypothetical protein